MAVNNPSYPTDRRSSTSVPMILLTSASVVLVGGALKYASDIFAPVLMAFFLMLLFRPLITRLEARKVPRGVTIPLSMVLVYSVILIIAGLVFLSLTRFARILAQNRDRFSDLINTITQVLQTFGVDTSDANQVASQISPEKLISAATNILSASASVLGLLAFLFAVAFFMALDAGNFSDRLGLVVRHRPAMIRAFYNLGHSVRSYFAVAAIFGGIVAVLDWILLAVLGIPYSWLWALLAFATNFVPNIGFVIGLVPPAIVGWLVSDWQTAVIIVIGYSVLNVVIQTLIQPKVVGDTINLNTTLTFLALVFWTFLLGGLGAILAIPMTLLVRALFVDAYPQHRWVRLLFSSGPPAGTGQDKKDNKKKSSKDATSVVPAAEPESAPGPAAG